MIDLVDDIQMHQNLLMSEQLQNDQEKSYLKKQTLNQMIVSSNTTNPHHKQVVFTEKQSPPSFENPLPFIQKDYCDPEIKAYFSSKITKNDENKSMALNIIDQKLTQFKDCIKQGFISIAGESRSVNDILSKSSHIAKEEQKLNEYLNQKNELEKELRRMEEAIQSANKDNTQSPKRKVQSGGTSLSQHEHQQFIERITQIKKQIDERKKIREQYQLNRMKQLQQKEAQILKQKQQKLKNQKRNQAKQHLQMILKRRQKMSQQQTEARKRFKSVSEKKRLHEQMEQQYHKKVYLPMIEERNKVLIERSKKLKEIKVEEILDYEKQYLKKREQRQQHSRSQLSSNWDYKHPPYSSKMIRILQEEKIAEKIREEQQKRRIQQLKSRQQNYKQYLKEKFSTVKIDEKKRLEISTIINKEKQKKQRNSEAFIKDIGNKYLSEARSRIKSNYKDKKQSLSTNQQATKLAKNRQSYKVKPSTSMSNYESSSSSQIKHNKIEQILTSRSINEQQKMKKLQFEIQRLSEKAQRKQLVKKLSSKQKQTDEEDLNNILNSIKAKMSFIELYKK